MGHLGHLKEEYGELLERFEGGQVIMPVPSDPKALAAWRELLEIYFTPEEARLACLIPLRPSSLEKVARAVGLAPAVAKRALDAMADKGLVMDLVHPETGQVRYFLAPPVVGFMEFSMMRVKDMYPKKRLAELLHAYHYGDRAFATEVFGGETVVGRALVRESLLDDEQLPDVLDWQRATSLIETAHHLAVGICYCRHCAEHLEEECDAPKEVCLSINAGAEFVVRRKFARAVDRSEALEILHRSREANLVQIADNVRNRANYICNCCGCCCGQLRSINDFELAGVNPSGFLPEFDDASCKGCSRCSRACPITAITMAGKRVKAKRKNELRPRLDEQRCIGCGVCGQVCKQKAVRMVQRGAPPHVPANQVERITRMVVERGRLAHLLVEQGMFRGAGFLNRVLLALAELPPAQRMLASKQVQSRFIQFSLRIVADPTGGEAR